MKRRCEWISLNSYALSNLFRVDAILQMAESANGGLLRPVTATLYAIESLCWTAQPKSSLSYTVKPSFYVEAAWRCRVGFSSCSRWRLASRRNSTVIPFEGTLRHCLLHTRKGTRQASGVAPKFRILRLFARNWDLWNSAEAVLGRSALLPFSKD